MSEPAVQEERAFPALTAMQESFVTNYVANGGNGKRAALAAGYSKSGAAVEACRMLRKAPVVEAIGQLSMLRLASCAPGAIGVVSKLMQHAKSEYVRLEAAKDVLTRVGLTAPTKVSVGGAVSITLDLG